MSHLDKAYRALHFTCRNLILLAEQLAIETDKDEWPNGVIEFDREVLEELAKGLREKTANVAAIVDHIKIIAAMIEETADDPGLVPLPDSPKCCGQFMQLYTRMHENKPIRFYKCLACERLLN